MENRPLQQVQQPELQNSNMLNVMKFFIFSAIGIFVFFVPVTLNGKSLYYVGSFCFLYSTCGPKCFTSIMRYWSFC